MSKRSEDMLCQALDLAENAIMFYNATLESCSNPVSVDIFQKLKQDKAEHLDRIKSIHDGLAKGDAWSDACSLPDEDVENAKKVFEEVAKKYDPSACPASEMESLETAIEMELKMMEFYQDKADKAEDDVERQFLDRMVQETRGHYILLNDMKLYFEDPEAWHMEHERAGLDGA